MKKQLEEKLPKISKPLATYIKALKDSKRNEVYETLILMILNKKLLQSIEDLIKKNFNSIEEDTEGQKIRMKIDTSTKEYASYFDLVCKSKYFKKHFTENEMQRKRYIMSKIVLEISVFFLYKKYDIPGGLHLDKDGVMVAMDSVELDHPLIDHSCTTKKGTKKFTLTFEDAVTLDDITRYAKNVLGIKNAPKKKKLNLERDYNLLLISQDIRDNIDKYKNENYTYIEELISKKAQLLYGEKITTEAVSKNIQRMRKVIKDINSLETNN